MKSYLLFILLFVFALNASVFAQNHQGGKIELGDLEVHGSVRKPMIQYIESDQIMKRKIRELSLKRFQEFEAELLKPASPQGVMP